MRLFGRIAWMGQAWLTAVMMLITGIPHFSCLCPDGRVKPFCLNLASETLGCCCGGTCCSATNGGTCCRGAKNRVSTGQRQVAPCCGQKHSPTSHDAVGQRCCGKTVAQPDVYTVSPSKTSAAKIAPVVAFLLPVGAPALALPTVACGRWEKHLQSPPTDLSTLLQRLLI